MIADVELLREHWCEPTRPFRLDLSTLIQQLLSLIAQHGGARPEEAYRALCGKGGPFTEVTRQQFGSLVRELATRDVLMQSNDRTLLAGPRGDREINHYSFYSAFPTAEEYRLVHGDVTLGTMPVDNPIQEDQLIIFAGRRWRILALREEDKVIQLTPALGGRPIIAGPSSGRAHNVVRRRMQQVLADDSQFPYLDTTAQHALEQARRAYAELRLDEQHLIRDGQDVLVLPWTGDLELGTLAQLMIRQGLMAASQNLALVVRAPVDEVRASLQAIIDASPPNELELARDVLNKRTAKYDHWLGDDLLAAQYATTHLDCAAALDAIRSINTEELRTTRAVSGCDGILPDSAIATRLTRR